MSHPAIFLDRDDTLIEDPGYINNPGQVHLLPHAAETLIELRRLGYRLVVVTNQSAVARGIVTEEGLAEIHDRLIELLHREGAGVDAIYYCPYHPNGIVPEYRRDSDLRKPNPGMLLLAADEMDLDLERSWMLGNSYRDIAAGQRAGCRTILVTSAEKPVSKKPTDPVPFRKAVNLREAVNIIKTFDQQRPIARAEAAAPAAPVSHAEPVSRMMAEGPSPEPPRVQTVQASEPAEPIARTRPSPPDEAPEPPAQTASPESLEPQDTDDLLREIVRLLKAMHRQDMFHEFSIMKALAGVVQVAVVFCLMWSLWLLLDAGRPPAHVHTLLGYTAVLQLMVIAFYMMRDRR